jgi:predicted nucleotidyltransferase component of viral defense system
MTKEPPKDVAASVRARLAKLARERGEDFQLVLTRYANERLLYRLASSKHGQNFVLKGAALFTLWTGRPHRATRDLDLLGFGEHGEAALRRTFAEIIALDVGNDGVVFEMESLLTHRIREDQEYGGIRIELFARVKEARVKLQVDVGFGDAITPEASVVEFPALLDFAPPKLRAYPRETVVAEKLEAIVQLGLANTRMKDFYDLAVLARDFDFEGETVARAIRATFTRRKTTLQAGLPVGLTADFAEDPVKKTQWSGFVRKTGARELASLGEAIAAAASFVEEPLAAAAENVTFAKRWQAGGPWRSG